MFSLSFGNINQGVLARISLFQPHGSPSCQPPCSRQETEKRRVEFRSCLISSNSHKLCMTMPIFGSRSCVSGTAIVQVTAFSSRFSPFSLWAASLRLESFDTFLGLNIDTVPGVFFFFFYIIFSYSLQSEIRVLWLVLLSYSSFLVCLAGLSLSLMKRRETSLAAGKDEWTAQEADRGFSGFPDFDFLVFQNCWIDIQYAVIWDIGVEVLIGCRFRV